MPPGVPGNSGFGVSVPESPFSVPVSSDVPGLSVSEVSVPEFSFPVPVSSDVPGCSTFCVFELELSSSSH